MRRITTSKVIKQFGDWVVTTYGLENTASYYPIEASRLWQASGTHGDWEHHLAAKNWTVDKDTNAALAFAREHHAAKRRTHVS